MLYSRKAVLGSNPSLSATSANSGNDSVPRPLKWSDMVRLSVAIALLALLAACEPATNSSSPTTPSPSPHGFLVLLLQPDSSSPNSKV